MSEFFDRVKHDAFKGDYLTRLLYLNIAVFLAYSLTNAFTSLFTGNFGLIPNIADNLLALPSSPFRFALRPWTILTYMFTHFGFRHILFNMIILYFSGKMLMEYLGERRMLALYIYGGIGGGVLYIILYNISPILTSGSMVGASAGVIAILVAGALYMPNMPVRLWGIFEVKYWMLAAGLVLLDVLNLTSANAGGHIAHLGGAIVAFFFIRKEDRLLSLNYKRRFFVTLFSVAEKVSSLHLLVDKFFQFLLLLFGQLRLSDFPLSEIIYVLPVERMVVAEGVEFDRSLRRVCCQERDPDWLHVHVLACECVEFETI